MFVWGVVIHPFSNSNWALTKPPLNIGYGEQITTHVHVDVIPYPCPDSDERAPMDIAINTNTVKFICLRTTLLWRHNGSIGVSNHQPHDCLLNRSFGRRSKKTSKLRVSGHCAGNSPVTGELPHKWPVMRKMFPFDDVNMNNVFFAQLGTRDWYLFMNFLYMSSFFHASFILLSGLKCKTMYN